MAVPTLIMLLVAGAIVLVGLLGLVLLVVGLVKKRVAMWVCGLIAIVLAGLVLLVAGPAMLFFCAGRGFSEVHPARQMGALTDIANISVAMDAFEADCGRYPITEEGLRALVEQPSGLANWMGPYVKSMPEDPWGNPYVYRCPGQQNTDGYDLYSFGPDGQDGGGDDIGNWSQR